MTARAFIPDTMWQVEMYEDGATMITPPHYKSISSKSVKIYVDATDIVDALKEAIEAAVDQVVDTKKESKT